MLIQTRALLVARLQLVSKSKRAHVLSLLSGAFALVLLSSLQVLANTQLTAGEADPPSFLLPSLLPPCDALAGTLRPIEGGGSEAGCYSLLYLPRSEEVADLLAGVPVSSARDVAPLPGAVRWPLAPEVAGWVEPALLPEGAVSCEGARGVCGAPEFWLTGRCEPCAFTLDNRTLFATTRGWPDSVRVVAIFLAPYLGYDLQADATYVLLSNFSAASWPLRRRAPSSLAKKLIDSALLLGGAAGGAAAALTATGGPPLRTEPPPLLTFFLRGFPRPPVLSAAGFDAFGASGAQWTFLMPALLCFSVLTTCAGEKEGGLRGALGAAGLAPGAHLLSWAALCTLVSVASTAVLLVAGWATRVPFFVDASPAATGPLYVLTCLAYSAVAGAAAGCVRTSRAAASAGAAIALVSFVFICVVNTGGAEALNLLWLVDMPPWKRAARTAALLLVPALPYACVLADVLARVRPRGGGGGGFAAAHLLLPSTGEVLGHAYARPAPLWCLFVLAGDALAFAAVGAAADGAWGWRCGGARARCCFARARRGAGDAGNAATEPLLGLLDPRPYAGGASRDGAVAGAVVLDVADLHVVRGGGGWGVGGARAPACAPRGAGASGVHAVRGISLSVRKGECVVLLGRNGAGKSSTFAAVSGEVAAASGWVATAGRPGVCAQGDVFFEALTVRQMVALVAGVKGVPHGAPLRAAVAEALAALDLRPVAERCCGDLSGGYRRRLSVALAALGAPELLLLDECVQVIVQVTPSVGPATPTQTQTPPHALPPARNNTHYVYRPSAGLDPLARASLQRVVAGLRRGAGVLVTTHDLHEAAALGDRVAILAAGRLVAVGSPAELCTRFGGALTLRLTLASGDAGTVAAVGARVAALAPAAAPAPARGDPAAFTFFIPPAAADAQLPALLTWCQSCEGAALVRQFALDTASLEGAFFAATEGVSPGAAGCGASGAGAAAEEEGRGGGGAAADAAAALDASLAAGTGGAAAFYRVHSPPVPLTALLCKNATLTWRSRLCALQLLLPLALVGALKSLLYFLALRSGGTTLLVDLPSVWVPVSPNFFPLPALQGGRAVSPAALLGALALRLRAGGGGGGGGTTLLLPPDDSEPCLQYYFSTVEPLAGSGWSERTLADALGAFPATQLSPVPPLPPPPGAAANASGLLAHVPAWWCPLPNGSWVGVPFAAPRAGGRAAVNDELRALLAALPARCGAACEAPPPCWPPDASPAEVAAAQATRCAAFLIPDGAWVLHALNTTREGLGLSMTLQLCV
jgi:ABC-type multidrug transport system ATPase subunit